jgi:D-glycero-alpha-D-manno-heptose-7-phosphate kinase
MLLVKVPLRISFFGGGSDIPSYYEKYDGLCVSTTINSFMYLAVHECTANHIKVAYSQMELVNDICDLKHSRVRETLKYYEKLSNIEIASFSDFTVKGTGLGSSSSFTVGLIQAINYIKYKSYLNPKQLAELASYIEIKRCMEPIGKQDQYAAAYGGLNAFRFTWDNVYVSPVNVDSNDKLALESRLLFYNTGESRDAADVLSKQVADNKTGTNIDTIKTMVSMAEESLKLLRKHKISDFGKLLHESWLLKKSLSPNMSSNRIDEMYDTAIRHGALGGKLLGAGNGGFLMIFVSRSNRQKVIDAMRIYERRDFRFYSSGSEIV